MKKLKFSRLSLIGCLLPLLAAGSGAMAEEKNYLDCEGGICRLAGTQLPYPEESENLDFEAVFTIRSHFDCPGMGRFSTGITLSADGNKTGEKLTINETKDVQVVGMGPVIIRDNSPRLTEAIIFDPRCRLWFEYKGALPSNQQVIFWKNLAHEYAASLKDQVGFYSFRSQVTFWIEKLDADSNRFFPLLLTYRDGLKKQVEASPGNVILQARLVKIEEIIAQLPSETILKEFEGVKAEAQKSYGQLSWVTKRLRDYGHPVPEEIGQALESAARVLSN